MIEDPVAELRADIARLERDIERVRAIWRRVNASLYRDRVDEDVLRLAVALRKTCARLSLAGSIDRAWAISYREPIDLLGSIEMRHRN